MNPKYIGGWGSSRDFPYLYFLKDSDTQNHRVFGLSPLTGILKKLEKQFGNWTYLNPQMRD
jgi:hypothetical protein